MKAIGTTDYRVVLDYKNWIDLDKINENQYVYKDSVNITTSTSKHIDSESIHIDLVYDKMRELNKVQQFFNTHEMFRHEELLEYMNMPKQSLTALYNKCLVKVKYTPTKPTIDGKQVKYQKDTTFVPLIELDN